MFHLRPQLQRLRQGGARSAPPLPLPDAVGGLGLRLAQRYPEKPPPPDLAARVQPALDRLRSAGPPGMRAADWNLVAAALWHHEPPLAADRELLGAYLAWLEREGRRADWRLLIEAYVAAFGPDQPGLWTVAASLAGAVGRWRWGWGLRHRNFDLFDPEAGPDKIARHALIEAPDVTTALAQAGLEGARAHGGLSRAVFLAATTLVGGFMSRTQALSPAVIMRLLDRLLPWGFDGDRLRFAGTEGALAAGLLLPWQHQTPERALTQRLIAFFLDALGDVRQAEPGWRDAPEAAALVFRRWLTATALSQYFPVVEALGFDAQATRRAFWMGYFVAGHITDAWGVYATALTRSAPGARIPVGQILKEPGLATGQVVLLMRIGHAIVADWSHNGRCHVWHADDPAAPALFAARYRAQSLQTRKARARVLHNRGESGVWQRQLAELLKTQGGVVLAERAYMPAGWRWLPTSH